MVNKLSKLRLNNLELKRNTFKQILIKKGAIKIKYSLSDNANIKSYCDEEKEDSGITEGKKRVHVDPVLTTDQIELEINT